MGFFVERDPDCLVYRETHMVLEVTLVVRCTCDELVECQGSLRVDSPGPAIEHVVQASGECSTCESTFRIDQRWNLVGAV